MTDRRRLVVLVLTLVLCLSLAAAASGGSRAVSPPPRRSAAVQAPRTWLAAVSLVGRYFGRDVAAWERSCSQHGSEGGWGRWFWNGGFVLEEPERLRLLAASAVPARPAGSSGAGGWLQFLHGTFLSVIDRGLARARALGLRAPASARSWLSPLGQAIAGAQMLHDGRRGEWSGWGC